MEERREGMAALTARVDGIDKKLIALEEYQVNAIKDRTEFKEQLAANTSMTEQIKKDTAGVVEMFSALQGGFKVLGILGQIGKWIAYIAGAVTAVWAALHVGNGIRPK